jgi:hypothetical protein
MSAFAPLVTKERKHEEYSYAFLLTPIITTQIFLA